MCACASVLAMHSSIALIGCCLCLCIEWWVLREELSTQIMSYLLVASNLRWAPKRKQNATDVRDQIPGINSGRSRRNLSTDPPGPKRWSVSTVGLVRVPGREMRWFGWRPCVTRLLLLLLWPVMVAVVVMSIALFFMTPRTRALTGLTRLRLLDVR